jgi:hypothetical protein
MRIHLKSSGRVAAATGVLGVCLILPIHAQQSAAADAPQSAKIWIGREAEIENYLRTAQVVKLADVSVGVTHPRKATLAPGGPVEAFAWKVIPPNRYEGFWESYWSEIAAYELNKLLELHMIPPTVEREYKGDRGAAVMWASPTKSFKDMGSRNGAPEAPPQYANAFARQIVKAKMFDNLINNTDPNAGNWLVDPSWNLILIDHTRAFTPGKNMIHEMNHIDADLWTRMRALTEASIQSAIGKWLMRGEAKSLIERRDKMQQIIDALVKAHGEAFVFMKGQ